MYQNVIYLFIYLLFIFSRGIMSLFHNEFHGGVKKKKSLSKIFKHVDPNGK